MKQVREMGSSKAPENLILLAGSMDEDSRYPLNPYHSICRLRKPSDPIRKRLYAVDSGSCRNLQLVKAERISYRGALCHRRAIRSHALPKAQELLMKGGGNIVSTRGEKGWEQNRVFQTWQGCSQQLGTPDQEWQLISNSNMKM